MKELKFRDVVKTTTRDNDEAFVNGDKYSSNIYFADKSGSSLIIDPYKLTLGILRPKGRPDCIYSLRDTTAQKLALVADSLRKRNNRYRLVLAYGFRPLEIQQEIFNRIYLQTKNETEPNTSEEELLEKVNQLIAVPEVAGHPTGGAVDVNIWQWDKEIGQGTYLDMGYPLLDLDGDAVQMSSKAKNLTKEQESNRQLLLESMTDQGFAPFWGEWWHFSYGDKEWATYYSAPNNPLIAIYSQKTTNEARQLYYRDFTPPNYNSDLFGDTFWINRSRNLNVGP